MAALPSFSGRAGVGGDTGAGKHVRFNRAFGAFALVFSRVAGTAAVLALLGAWVAAARGGPVLGMTEQHLFNDAIVLSLFSIGALLDSMVHHQAVSGGEP